MASQVYSPTTAPNPKDSWFMVPSDNLDKIRFGIKVVEVLFSFVAFILEEVVSSCVNCSSLYFFEFVSCTAFLFTLLLLILLSTVLHTRVGITCWPSLVRAHLNSFNSPSSSLRIVFASDHSGSAYENIAVVFGFFATVLFAVDLIMFVKTQGFPFKKDGKPEASNGGPAVGPAQPEEEKLNPPTQ
uniref:CKLF-like MARVEL transmembrane domain containing 6 n=1 Tax=Sparus aurata TaxID=8175 RepID=A0A671TTN9_SPAAU